MPLKSLLRILGHQKWIRFGIRDRIIRTFDNIDTRPKELFSVPFFGQTYTGDLSVYIDWSTYYYGSYEGEELSLMRDALTGVADPIVLDIGANIGHHSLFASTLAKEVHAFEPFPEVFSKIYDKIKINSINNIKVHEIGLGETNETLPYSVPSNSNTGVGSFSGEAVNNSSTIYLPIRVGDEYLKSYNLPKIDYIKMDIEGFESQALRGLKNTILFHRPIVFFEWSAYGRKLNIESESLFPKDYTVYNFISKQPYLGVFSKRGYILVADQSPFRDGNKIAIPNEQIARFNSIKSL
ncbi:FkbM family methyltransferase [Tellurirhabdus bombi]|uniref:FkbM family methyltransferase n=1 Tax=Tellurirhabdus bombi TaxID=2907205 RepID=UPI001F2E3CF2|nr:FkbM family methyltransferase [Tellurirhabdus bombi]